MVQTWRNEGSCHCAKKATIHQVTTMLATSKNCTISRPQPPANHRCWWPDTLVITRVPGRSSVPVVSRWLWPGSTTFLEVASMVVTWWIVPWHPHHCQHCYCWCLQENGLKCIIKWPVTSVLWKCLSTMRWCASDYISCAVYTLRGNKVGMPTYTYPHQSWGR